MGVAHGVDWLVLWVAYQTREQLNGILHPNPRAVAAHSEPRQLRVRVGVRVRMKVSVGTRAGAGAGVKLCVVVGSSTGKQHQANQDGWHQHDLIGPGPWYL